MAALRETIAVVDKSGKVVTTSKHLLDVFKEARNAYRERKAGIQAEKQAKIAEREARRAMAALEMEDRQDKRSVASSRKSGRSKTGRSRHSHHHHHRSDHPRAINYEQDLHHNNHYSSVPPAPRSLQSYGRRHTEHTVMGREQAPVVRRAKTESHVDMDLAYGEVHPSVLQRYDPAPEPADEEELNVLVSKAKDLLVEAECLQYSATATIAHLKKHPDAMAAVALTLAEISNLVAKMAPGILASLKASAPAVFALLASPQFLIAAGVGIGVTIVMFGGYKIIKQITAANNQGPTPDMNQAMKVVPDTADGDEELMELQSEHLSRVEAWRRGVADAEAGSAVSTVVDGEFITPTAAAMSGLDMSKVPKSSRGATGGGRSKYEDLSTAPSSRRTRRSRFSKRSSRSGGGGSDDKKKRKENGKEKTTPKMGKSNKLKLMFLA